MKTKDGRSEVYPIRSDSGDDFPERYPGTRRTVKCEEGNGTRVPRRLMQDATIGLLPIGRPFEQDDPITPEGVAAGFASAYSQELRYDFSRGWLEFRRGRWRPTRIRGRLAAYIAATYSKGVVQKLSREVNKILPELQEAMALEPGWTWDGEPDLLGLPDDDVLGLAAGAVHLPTGKWIEAGPSAAITKAAGCVPAAEVSDLWLRFLGEACGDEEMVSALQVAIGSAAYGHNRSHHCNIVSGDGGTGKSLALETVGAAFGDYGKALSAGVVVGRNDKHATFLADLQGVRYATVPELGGGLMRSDALKAIAAGDTLTANRMRKDPFQFRPVATMFLATNELPSVRSVDNSLQRRLRVWPFDHIPDEPDEDLGTRLRSPEHLPGVLRWVLDGARRYAVEGTRGMECNAVREATQAYFQTVDTVREWARTHLRRSGDDWTSTRQLRASYTRWCEEEGHRPASATAFSTKLKRLRYDDHRTDTARGFKVILTEGFGEE